MMKADADYHFTIVGRNPEQGFLEELRGHEQVTVIPNAETCQSSIIAIRSVLYRSYQVVVQD